MRTTDYRDLTQTDFRRSEIGFNLFLCMHWWIPQAVPGPSCHSHCCQGVNVICTLCSQISDLAFCWFKTHVQRSPLCQVLQFASQTWPVLFIYHCGISATFPAADLFIFSSKSFIKIMNSLGERKNHCRTLIQIPSWYLSVISIYSLNMCCTLGRDIILYHKNYFVPRFLWSKL